MVDVGAIAQAGAATFDTMADIGTSIAQTYANIGQARDARKWSAQQAASRHQVEVADMKKAGINPILSVDGGQGAPMPTNTVPEVVMPKLHMGEMLFNYAKIYQEIKNSEADQKLKESMVDKTKQETITEIGKQSLNSAMASRELSQQALNLKLSDKTMADIAKAIAEKGYTSALEKKVGIDTHLAHLEALKQEKVKGLYGKEPYGTILPILDATKGTNQGGLSSALAAYLIKQAIDKKTNKKYLKDIDKDWVDPEESKKKMDKDWFDPDR